MSLPMMGHADSCLQIDLNAIITNWRYIDSLSSATTTTAATVKANGYGLGAKEVAATLARAGCTEFFVANLDEAIELRKYFDEGGYEQLHIMTLHGCHWDQLDEYAAFRITPVLNDLEQLSSWRLFSQQRAKAGPKTRAKTWPGRLPAMLHIDTGMTRLGLDSDQADWLIQNKAVLDGLDCRYIMSHLSSAEVPGDPSNAAQLAAFNELRSWFPGMPASLANSAGSMLSPDFHFQMTRPGSALYGVYPGDVPTGKLAPVVRWKARIMQVRRAKAGDRVGYGGTHQLSRNSTIATIGAGYADGYNRMLGGKAHVLIGSQTAPVVGQVSMDSMTVDVTDVDSTHLRLGSVELLHDSYDLSHMAGDAETISYEILTKLGTRPKRHYLNS
jgi:alanine racemase